MTPADLAKDVIELMAETESGKSWVGLRTDKPRYVIRAPGDKTELRRIYMSTSK